MRYTLCVLFCLAAAGVASGADAPKKDDPVVAVTKVTPRPAAAGQKLTLAVTLTNAGNEDAVLNFRTGQRYDFVVESDGKEVWRWSRGRFFTMVLGTLELKPGEAKTYTTTWDQKGSDGKEVGPGTYTVKGIVTAKPAVAAPAVKVTIEEKK